MKIMIADINKVIEVNDLKEVKNPTYFEYKGVPTSDGIFSFEIFGRPGSYTRKTVFAYIDLIDWYLHPLIYKALIRLNRKFESCIAGIKFFKVSDNGEIEEVPESEIESTKGAGTGLKWLHKNWDKINFKETKANDSIQRIKMIKSLPKETIWMNKELIIPAYYRDINFEKIQYNIISRDEINEKYTRLLRLLSNIKFNYEYAEQDVDYEDPILNGSRVIIQHLLNDIYSYFTSRLEKKSGLFHKGIMGKSVDYAGISVISSPKINQETYGEMPVNFFKVGVPLYEACCLFYPFIVKWIADWFKNELESNKTIYIYNENTGKTEQKLIDMKTLDDYNENELYKRIKAFDKSPNSRFDVIRIRVMNSKHTYPLLFKGQLYNPITGKSYDSGIGNRPLTWTDLLYMAAFDVTKDKYLFLTRYPVTSNLSIYSSGIHVNSTLQTQKMIIEGQVYDYYPKIDFTVPYSLVQAQFIDTLVMFNGHLKALGADFDGDTLVLRGCFTQEANNEAKKLLYSISNILDVTGSNIRKTERDAIQCLYNLTRNP